MTEPSDLKKPLDLVAALSSQLGLDGLLTLLQHYAGVNIYVPRRIHKTHRLAVTLGIEVAEKLSRYVGGGDFLVPTGRGLYRLVRNQSIHSARASGVSLRSLARRFHLSERHICAVLAQRRKAASLPDPIH